MPGDAFDTFKDILSVDEPLSSGPVSGRITKPLFGGDAGPGHWIEDDERDPVKIEFTDLKATPGTVLRLSPAALWFAKGPTDRFGPREIRFRLVRGGLSIGPLRGKVTELDDSSQRPCAGLQLIGVSSGVGRQIVALINELQRSGRAKIAHEPSPVIEDIDDAERICSILTALSVVGSRGVLARGGARARVRAVDVDPQGRRVSWKIDGRLPEAEGPLSASIVGYNSVYRFYLSDVSEAEGEIIAALPAAVQRVRHRWFRRVAARAAVRVRFENPLWEEIEPTWRDVIDISLGGIRFTTEPDEDLLFPSLTLPYIEIETQFGTVIHLRGDVRNVIPAKDGAPASCGASVTPISPEDEIWWMRFVSGMLYDHSTQTSEHLTEPLWDLFRDSGYMNLAGKSVESFTYLKRRFSSVSRRAAITPRLMCQAVWPSNRGVEATLSFVKAYKHAWMVHQLAKRKTDPGEITSRAQVLWGIYTRAFEHSQSDPDMRWVISYVESQVPWVARTHLAFAERLAPTGECLALPVRMMSVSCAESGVEVPEGLALGPATPWEMLRVLGVISRTRPACYRDALDFTHDQVDLTDVTREWRRFGFERHREIVIAREGGRPIAALIVEAGEVGTNLFCLLDSARLIPLAPDGKRAYPALMDEARAWFSARRRTSFLYFREDQDTSYEEEARLHDEPGEPYLCIMSARVIPDFLEHVCEVSGSRRAAG